MPLGQDANFSDEAILTRFNADLANDLGNLVSRATTMVHRYRDGRVPESPADERQTRSIATSRPQRRRRSTRSKASFEAFQVSQALQDTWALVRAGQQIHRRARAMGAGEGCRQRRDCWIGRSTTRADALRVIAALVDPVMPDAAGRIRRMLGVDAPSRGHRCGGHARCRARNWRRSNRCSRGSKKPSRNYAA